MRDPNRIPHILDKIKKLWEKNPDLRLGQLIINATGIDPYYIEDDALVQALEALYNGPQKNQS